MLSNTLHNTSRPAVCHSRPTPFLLCASFVIYAKNTPSFGIYNIVKKLASGIKYKCGKENSEVTL